MRVEEHSFRLRESRLRESRLRESRDRKPGGSTHRDNLSDLPFSHDDSYGSTTGTSSTSRNLFLEILSRGVFFTCFAASFLISSSVAQDERKITASLFASTGMSRVLAPPHDMPLTTLAEENRELARAKIQNRNSVQNFTTFVDVNFRIEFKL